MARKRRAPSPPSPQEEFSSEESSSGEVEEEAQDTPAPQKPPQNPKPPSTAAANDDDDADSSEGGDEEQVAEESSDSETDAEAFQLRQVARSPSKPSAAASKHDSDADEEEQEEGDSSDDPEPVQKKTTKKPKADAGKKRPAPEPTLSGKVKKGKTEVEKAAPEPSPSAKAKKDKSTGEKTAPELTPSGKVKKPNAEPEKVALDSLPSSKSEKPKRSSWRWTIKDEIMILEALIGHVKAKGAQPSAGDLVATIGNSLDRRNCSYSEMYEKVRKLKQWYKTTAKKVASTGALLGKGDELQKYKLSEAIWGENAKEVASASVSQNDGASSKSKKEQTNKEKMDGHSKGGTSKEASTTANENVGAQTGRQKGQATKEKIDGDTKSRANTTDIPVKNKKQGVNHKEELVEDAKTGTLKETTTTATKDKIDGDAEGLGPKETTVATQNGAEGENEGTLEGMDIDANVRSIRRGLNELQNLYPNLTSYVESIKAQHLCGEILMRAFEFIDDQKASALESKIKKQRVAEVKMETRRVDTKKEVTNILIGLLE